MKLKIALLSMSVLLTGCVNMPEGPIYNASDIGVVKTQAEADAFLGETKFRPGTGITYTRKTNQCGSNCGKYAELAAKLDAEKKAREEAYEPQHQANLKQYARESKNIEIVQKCEFKVQLTVAARIDAYESAVVERGFNDPTTQRLGKEAIRAKKTMYRDMNQCEKEEWAKVK